MKRAKLELRPRTARLDAPPKVIADADPPPAIISGPLATPTTAARPPSREGTKALTFHVPRATGKRFARLALDLDRSQQALGEEALADLFAKYKA
jgi:hypothetical protein